jgi:hypothetical protein
MNEQVKRRLIEALLGKPIVGNAFRGTLVEAIVAEALEPHWRWCADGWGSYDFEGPGMLGLEVKQSAARQSWHHQDAKPCKPRFDIAERKGAYAETGEWVARTGRAAAIYVFAYHPVFDASIADHRVPEQWEFYVVPTGSLPQRKTIGLSGVRALAAKVGFGQLLEAVNGVAFQTNRVRMAGGGGGRHL